MIEEIEKDKKRLKRLEKEFEEIISKPLREYSKDVLIQRIEDLRKENKILERLIKSQKGKKREENVEGKDESYDILTLFKETAIKVRIKKYKKKTSYAERWFWDILIIISNEDGITIKGVANYIEGISERTIGTIIHTLSGKNFLRKEFRGKTCFYHLNREHLEDIVRKDKKRRAMTKLIGKKKEKLKLKRSNDLSISNETNIRKGLGTSSSSYFFKKCNIFVSLYLGG